MAGYYYFKDDMERNEVIIDPRNRGKVFNQTATSGSYPGGDIEVGYSNQIVTTRTKVAQLGTIWRPTDRQQFFRARRLVGCDLRRADPHDQVRDRHHAPGTGAGGSDR